MRGCHQLQVQIICIHCPGCPISVETVLVRGMGCNLSCSQVLCGRQDAANGTNKIPSHLLNMLSSMDRNGFPRGAMGWQGAAQNPSSYIVKKIVRLEVPTDAYPNFNFIGRLLGPRGHSLKRVEATTGCRVFIRGKGSIKDPVKEEQYKGRPGYEHLGDPTHILIEAELPADVIDARLAQAQEILEELLKPVDESQDNIKRQQLRELAMLNSVYREDSPHQNGSASPFSNGGTKQ
ncbi:hypothetical protein PAHAL_5G112900 [Panicum hallii]|uniref:K Homology domain-containing protein n=1 Tax=Panicum hallii TaxID=206008 RepID=A0A2S3HQR0_9POAL|nr:hypothetical protein PAHAL_5G112900 [Panicum hallii]